jgi:hypothetical protein
MCSICENPIIPRDGKDAFRIECMGRNFHENCYRCEVSEPQGCHHMWQLKPHREPTLVAPGWIWGRQASQAGASPHTAHCPVADKEGWEQ